MVASPFGTWQSGFGLAVHDFRKKSQFFCALGVEGIAFHKTDVNLSPSDTTWCSASPELLKTAPPNFTGSRRSDSPRIRNYLEKALSVEVSKFMCFSLT